MQLHAAYSISPFRDVFAGMREGLHMQQKDIAGSMQQCNCA